MPRGDNSCPYAPLDHLSRVPSRFQPPRGNHGRDGRAPGHHRVRRNRLGQDHAVAQDRPGTGARPLQCPRRHTRTPDRPHTAAAHCRQQRGQAHCRGAENPAGRGGGLQGALSRHAAKGRLGQADDRRHLAGRDADRPAAQGLRHPHHRRGARAQPEHRLFAGLPQANPAPAARPEGGGDLGHHRRRALCQALCGQKRPGAGDHGVGAHLPGGDALPALRGKERLRPERRHCRRRGRAVGRRAGRRHFDLLARRA